MAFCQGRNQNLPWISHRAIMSLTLHSTLVLVFVHPLGGVLQKPGSAHCSSIPSYICVQLGNQRGAPLAYILLKRTLNPSTPTPPPHGPPEHPCIHIQLKAHCPQGKSETLAHIHVRCVANAPRQVVGSGCGNYILQNYESILEGGFLGSLLKDLQKTKKKIICRKQFEDMQTE